MTDEAAAAASDTATSRPRTNGFRKRFDTVRLSAECAERQGRVARLAFEALGREGATLFLNSHDPALGSRPLDLAIASPEGLSAVERAIAARKADAC